MDNIQKFKQFYNSLVTLNNKIEQAKYYKRLDRDCLCNDITKSISVTKKFFIDTINLNQTDTFYCKDNSICDNLISGDELTYQKTKGQKYFDQKLKLLDTLDIKSKEKSESDKIDEEFLKDR